MASPWNVMPCFSGWPIYNKIRWCLTKKAKYKRMRSRVAPPLPYCQYPYLCVYDGNSNFNPKTDADGCGSRQEGFRIIFTDGLFPPPHRIG